MIVVPIYTEIDERIFYTVSTKWEDIFNHQK